MGFRAVENQGKEKMQKQHIQEKLGMFSARVVQI